MKTGNISLQGIIFIVQARITPARMAFRTTPDPSRYDTANTIFPVWQSRLRACIAADLSAP